MDFFFHKHLTSFIFKPLWVTWHTSNLHFHLFQLAREAWYKWFVCGTNAEKVNRAHTYRSTRTHERSIHVIWTNLSCLTKVLQLVSCVKQIICTFKSFVVFVLCCCFSAVVCVQCRALWVKLRPAQECWTASFPWLSASHWALYPHPSMLQRHMI